MITRVEKQKSNEAFLRELAKRVNYPIATRSVNALAAGGVDTEEKLLKLTEYDLRRAPNVGDLTVQDITELQRLLTGEIDLRNCLLRGLSDISTMVKDAPADNVLALEVKAKVNKVLRDYTKHNNL